jgi:hypothetical protein
MARKSAATIKKEQAEAEAAALQAVPVDEADTDVATIEGVVATLNEDNAPMIFGHGSLPDLVKKIEATIVDEVPDLSTNAGRERVASLAYRVARAKKAIDDHGRDHLRKLKALPKVIEGELRQWNTSMDALRDRIRAPLTELEQSEKAEKDRIQANIDHILSMLEIGNPTSGYLTAQLVELDETEFDEATFGGRVEEAQAKADHVRTTLEAQIKDLIVKEQEAAELAQLRREKAERDERDRQEAASKAEQDRKDEEARQRIKDAEQRAENARLELEEERRQSEQREENARNQERTRLENEQRQQREQEQRKADETARQEQARQEDKEHRGRVNSAALDTFIVLKKDGATVLTPAQAKLVVSAIIRGMIPGVQIHY